MAGDNNENRSLIGVLMAMIAAILVVPWSSGGSSSTASRPAEAQATDAEGDEGGGQGPPQQGDTSGLDRPFLEYLGKAVERAGKTPDETATSAAASASVAKTLADRCIAVTTLVMCIADPVSSSNGYRTDLQLETLQKSLKPHGYVADRWWLPWIGDDGKQRAQRGSPGVMLFRRIGNAEPGPTQRLLAVYLVGELMTAGIDRPALLKALDHGQRFLDAGDSDTKNKKKCIPILGPVFTGSADSLALALRDAREKPNPPNVVVLNSSATAFDKKRFDALLCPETVPYATTIASFPDQQKALLAYLKLRGGYDRIAWLLEAGTGFAANAGKATTSGTGDGSSPEIENFVFPTGIAQVRDAYAKAAATGPATPLTSPADRTMLRFPAEARASARDLVPRFAPGMQGPYTELSLRHLLLDIARKDFDAVGITATDHRDRLFLVEQLRRHAPDAQILLVGGDLAYDHPGHRQAMLGALVVSAYPPFIGHHLWPRAATKEHLALPAQAQNGLFNAVALALDMASRPDCLPTGTPLAEWCADSAMVDTLRHYEEPVSGSGDGSVARPPLWISTIGYQGAWPLTWVSSGTGPDAAPIGILKSGTNSTAPASGPSRWGLPGVHHQPLQLTQLVIILLVLALLTSIALRGGFASGQSVPMQPGNTIHRTADWMASDEWIRPLAEWAPEDAASASPHRSGERRWRLGGPLFMLLGALWLPTIAAASVAWSGLIAGAFPGWDGKLASLPAAWSLGVALVLPFMMAPWRVPHFVRASLVAAAAAVLVVGLWCRLPSPWLVIVSILAATAAIHLASSLLRSVWQAWSRATPGEQADFWLTFVAWLANTALLMVLASGGGGPSTRLPWLLTSAWVFNGVSHLLPLGAAGLALAVIWYVELVRSWRADEYPVASSGGSPSPHVEEDQLELELIRYPLLGRHAPTWLREQLAWSWRSGSSVSAPTPIGVLQLVFLVVGGLWLVNLATRLSPVYPDMLAHRACVALLMTAFLSWALLLVRTQALVGFLEGRLHRFRSEVEKPGAELEKVFTNLHRPADVSLGRLLYARRPPASFVGVPEAKGTGTDGDGKKPSSDEQRVMGMKYFVRSLGGQIRWLLGGLVASAVLLFVAATSLPCQPRSDLLFTSTLAFIGLAWLVSRTLLWISRDRILNLIAATPPAKAGIDLQTAVRIAVTAGIPVLLILGQAFPDTWQWLGALAEGWHGS